MDTNWDLVDATMHSGPSASGSGSGQPSAASNGKEDDEAKKHERNMQLALHHANLLQQRKNIEAGILKSTIALIDFPTSQSADPASPSPSDASEVKKHLKYFQPSDYDALIQERNIEKKCGYVLCPRPHAEDNHKGKYAILHNNRDLKIIRNRDLKRWCSEECARRAMYVRVQLSETPAWERQDANKLQLYEEDDEDEEDVPQREAVANMTADLKKLALERGIPNGDDLVKDFQEMNIPHR